MNVILLFILAPFVAVLELIIVVLMCYIISVLRSSKYEFIYQKDENGEWNEVPVCHPYGEPIDEDFIKLWNERKIEYEEDMKRRKHGKQEI